MNSKSHPATCRPAVPRVPRTIALAATLLAALPLPGHAAPAPGPAPTEASSAPAVTRHVTIIGGERVAYTATVLENPVPGPDGQPGATLITIAYTRDEVGDPARRPVIFAFNGGPGASSSPLHMKAMGPVMRVSADPAKRDDSLLTENPESPLDVADIVFLDPVSTGFSRAYPGVDARYWYDGKHDALAAASAIEQWLKRNNREASPRYLAGESYGTYRAALILRHAPALRFDGVLLISGGTGGEAAPDDKFVAAIPSMAAGAWFHRRIDRRGRDVGTVYREAARFARRDYAAALARGAALPTAEKHQIAVRLSHFIGLPAALIEANDLRVDANSYMFNLLKDEGLRTGRLDLRMTSPLVENASGAIDDPALGVVKPGQAATKPVTPAELGAIPSPVVERYITEQLRYASRETYYGVNFTANSQWTFDPVDPPVELAAAMKADPKLRLFVTTGYFDYAAGDERNILAAGVSRKRLTFLHLPGPHEVYAGPENLRAFNAAVRAFVRAK